MRSRTKLDITTVVHVIAISPRQSVQHVRRSRRSLRARAMHAHDNAGRRSVPHRARHQSCIHGRGARTLSQVTCVAHRTPGTLGTRHGVDRAMHMLDEHIIAQAIVIPTKEIRDCQHAELK